jgi:hypothetical protein
MVLLISYDLNGHERPRSYETVRKLIEQNASAWIRPLYSQWLVDTNASPAAWSNTLMGALDADDGLLIVQVTNRSYHGRLDQPVWDWLQARALQPAS